MAHPFNLSQQSGRPALPALPLGFAKPSNCGLRSHALVGIPRYRILCPEEIVAHTPKRRSRLDDPSPVSSS